jgi:hypothetical protein
VRRLIVSVRGGGLPREGGIRQPRAPGLRAPHGALLNAFVVVFIIHSLGVSVSPVLLPGDDVCAKHGLCVVGLERQGKQLIDVAVSKRAAPSNAYIQ